MPTPETVAQHKNEIDTLHEWSGEDLDAGDMEAFAELADEARAAREADGTVAMEAAQAAADAKRALADEREAQADTHWQGNPEARL